MENVRISSEYVHIDLDQDTKCLTHNCGLDAIEITNGEARIAHSTYDVKFSYEHQEGYDEVTLVWVTPRADHRQEAEDILNKIRQSDGPKPSDSSINLVDKLKGDLEDSHNESLVDFLKKG
jgi:hypothetical protein